MKALASTGYTCASRKRGNRAVNGTKRKRGGTFVLTPIVYPLTCCEISALRGPSSTASVSSGTALKRSATRK